MHRPGEGIGTGCVHAEREDHAPVLRIAPEGEAFIAMSPQSEEKQQRDPPRPGRPGEPGAATEHRTECGHELGCCLLTD